MIDTLEPVGDTKDTWMFDLIPPYRNFYYSFSYGEGTSTIEARMEERRKNGADCQRESARYEKAGAQR